MWWKLLWCKVHEWRWIPRKAHENLAPTWERERGSILIKIIYDPMLSMLHEYDWLPKEIKYGE